MIDERFNGGGQVADYFIEVLGRHIESYWAPRYGVIEHTPNAAIYGPKVMIANENSGSGGDALPWLFKQAKLGPLVGKRTWGGLVGIGPIPVLMDGGHVTSPSVAFFSPGGQWEVENHGVDPDYPVEQDPKAVSEGHDPQLEKAVALALEEVAKHPPTRWKSRLTRTIISRLASAEPGRCLAGQTGEPCLITSTERTVTSARWWEELPMHGIPLFLGFLVANLAWWFVLLRAGAMLGNITLQGLPLVSTELLLLPSLAAFFGFIYMLSGFYSGKLVLVMLVAVHLGPLTAWFLTNAFGRNTKSIVAREFWSGFEIGAQNPRLVLFPIRFTTFMLVCYPFVTGYFYFRYPWGSPVLQSQVIKCTLLLLTLSSYALVAVLVPKMLASENLDDDTRQTIFFTQLGGLIPIGVYLAIGAAAFGIDRNAIRLDVFGAAGKTLSLELLGLLFAFFAVTSLVPYLVGAQRARVKEMELVKRARDIVTEIEDMLAVPGKSTYVEKLEFTGSQLEQGRKLFLQEEPIFDSYEKISQKIEEANENEKRLKSAMDQTGLLDARARYLALLERLQLELTEIAANLQQRREPDIEEAAAKWGKRYEGRKVELTQKLEELEKRRPIVAAGLGSGLVIIVSGILGEVAKAAWTLISSGK